ncbi:hypothetical protein [Burkholderia lata]|uniref:hypothetical protein n=1 Tax=Burkholderia lata (strain ATCC 17760 / DSM 23089 / LMG 22485 / NCIMB 9086 / R18194 / 383) TaxID=482957 RepID=UPI00399A550B
MRGCRVAGTDLVLTVARRNLDRVRDDARLRMFEPPFPIDAFEFAQHWHERRHGDAAHIWLRQTIARVASGG